MSTVAASKSKTQPLLFEARRCQRGHPTISAHTSCCQAQGQMGLRHKPQKVWQGNSPDDRDEQNSKSSVRLRGGNGSMHASRVPVRYKVARHATSPLVKKTRAAARAEVESQPKLSNLECVACLKKHLKAALDSKHFRRHQLVLELFSGQ
eukprot:3728188-Karenia_brevis.AAC.1